MDYQEFLKQKIKSGKYFGFDIDESEINPMLFPHQKDIVRWCIKGGRRAIFASFGLGKSFMQLEILRLIQKHKSGNQLIIAPLGVIQEFKVDAEKLGINITFIRKTDQVTAPGLYITNYESVREEKLDINLFNGVSLDEASVLRSYGSKTFQTFLTMFDTIPYRFVATATPSPNRFKELIHYSGFLGIMDSGQALAQPLYSKVLTPLGWKKMGDIKAGDDVISSNGNSSKVLSIHPQGEKDIYRVFFSDNSFADCTEDHLWETQTQYERNAYKKYVKRNGLLGDKIKKYFTIKTTSEIKKTLRCKSTGAKNHSIPIVKPIHFNKKDILFDPYVIGLILGDGHIRKTSINLLFLISFLILL